MDPARAFLQMVVFDSTSESDPAQTLDEAWQVLADAAGYLGHQFGPCVEHPSRHVLLIWWRAVEDHVVTFRQSAPYGRWRRLIESQLQCKGEVQHFVVPGQRP